VPPIQPAPRRYPAGANGGQPGSNLPPAPPPARPRPELRHHTVALPPRRLDSSTTRRDISPSISHARRPFDNRFCRFLAQIPHRARTLVIRPKPLHHETASS